MMDLWATVPYYTAYLSRALLAEGVDVMVGSITYYLDPTCYSSRGIKVDPGLIDIVGKFRLPRLLRRVMKMLEALINLAALTVRFMFSPPDAVHVQYLPMLKWRLPLDFWFLEFCRKRGAKIVLTVHDLLPHDTGQTYKNTFLKLYELSDRMICHSDHVKALLELEFTVSSEKISVIPHGPFFYDLPSTGVEQTRSRVGMESDAMLVLWQGIIFPYKGVDLLLRAWQRVESSGSKAYLMIAGTGALELLKQIRDLIDELQLKRVKLDFRFISVLELVTLYRAADVVVYPYRAITTSGALATGLALGKTIVASDLPVFRELLTNRENALVIDPEDTGKLADALIELSQDVMLRKQLSESVREMKFGDQSWITIAQKTKMTYENASHSQK